MNWNQEIFGGYDNDFQPFSKDRPVLSRYWTGKYFFLDDLMGTLDKIIDFDVTRDLVDFKVDDQMNAPKEALVNFVQIRRKILNKYYKSRFPSKINI